MANTPQEHLSILRHKIELQRNTVELLKRNSHLCTDAERQLTRMVAELRAAENLSPHEAAELAANSATVL